MYLRLGQVGCDCSPEDCGFGLGVGVGAAGTVGGVGVNDRLR
jgi:hypothetical protein